MSDHTYTITESQRRDLMQMLEWAEWALNEHTREAKGKPWEESLRAEQSACGYLWDMLNLMCPPGEPLEVPFQQECGGCGRINDAGDDVCLCDMERFRKERPDEYADMVEDGIL
jgi:hypothetical protein